jgi:hypothetical protein
MIGALWVGLLMAVGGDPAPPPPPSPPASEPFVAVMQPPDADYVLVEAASRIRSELAASGLQGRLIDCSQRVAEDPPCPDPATRETISLRREDGVVEINVRVIATDGLELARRVRVIARDGGDDASVLAVRAVELLGDVRLNARRPAPAGPQQAARDDEEPLLPAPPPRPPRWILTAGAAVLGSPSSDKPGIGPTPGIALAAGAVVGRHVLVFASLAGPFDNSLETASLIQVLGTLELRYRFALGPVEPYVALLGGVNYLRATIPNVGLTTSAWVPLFGAGIGVSKDFSQRFTAGLEIEAFLDQPDILLYTEGNVAGRAGAPSILVTSSAGLLRP